MEQRRLIQSRYRADVDGLRAVAILSVVGFHAFPNAISGGYVGVDIFFVISGFLISHIIFSSLTENSFSFHEFYARRIRRIFPALLLVLLASYIFGWYRLFASEYGQLGKHIAGGAGFVSNLLFMNEAGYFDSEADTKQMLHLWSLAIEEQFYIVWPFILWLIWKSRVDRLLLLSLLVVVSFGANLANTYDNNLVAFYSPFTRIWELMVGSLLAHLTLQDDRSDRLNKLLTWSENILAKMFHRIAEQPGTIVRDATSIVGAMMLVIGVLSITKRSHFPGWLAWVPVGGAFLLLAAGPSSWFNRRVLSCRVLVWVGLISYPLYLWHWPILSFMRVIEGRTPPIENRLAAVMCSIVLAWFTYRLVERPVRSGMGRNTVVLLSIAMIAIGCVGYFTYQQHGLLNRPYARDTQPLLSTLARTSREAECFDILNAHKKTDNWFCHLNAGSAPRIFVFGDSHALSLFPVFEKIAKNTNQDILFAGYSGCPPLLGVAALRGDQDIRNCQALNDRIFTHSTQNNITDVFLIGRWTYYTDGRYDDDQEMSLIHKTNTAPTKDGSRIAFGQGIDETFLRFSRAGIKVHIVRDIPLQLRSPRDLIRAIQSTTAANREAKIDALSISLLRHRQFQSFANSTIDKAAANQEIKLPIDIIDLDEAYCNQSSCPFAKNNISYYYDTDHLSVSGALLSERVLAKRF